MQTSLFLRTCLSAFTTTILVWADDSYPQTSAPTELLIRIEYQSARWQCKEQIPRWCMCTEAAETFTVWTLNPWEDWQPKVDGELGVFLWRGIRFRIANVRITNPTYSRPIRAERRRKKMLAKWSLFLKMQFVRFYEDILVYTDAPHSRTSAPAEDVK